MRNQQMENCISREGSGKMNWLIIICVSWPMFIPLKQEGIIRFLKGRDITPAMPMRRFWKMKDIEKPRNKSQKFSISSLFKTGGIEGVMAL